VVQRVHILMAPVPLNAPMEQVDLHLGGPSRNTTQNNYFNLWLNMACASDLVQVTGMAWIQLGLPLSTVLDNL